MALDPAVRAALPRYFGTEEPPPDDPLAASRDWINSVADYGPTAAGEVTSSDEIIEDVPVRISTPANPGGPVFVFFHGGGWASGNIRTHDVFCRAFATRLPAVVVDVEYRLAPEHPFPAAVQDAWQVTQTVAGNPEGFGGSRVVVGGDSAGGNLAAVVARRARDAGLDLAGQVLIYPVVDRPADRSSYRRYHEGYGLTRAAMEFYWRQYVGDDDVGDDPDATPIHCTDLYGLPPAVVVTAECDVLCDEGEEYARRLRSAGVPVASACCEGLVHGFLRIAGDIAVAGAGFDRVISLMSELFGYRGDGARR
jgi:acetyl esterase